MEQNVQQTPDSEKLGIVLSILCFILPLVGLILYFVFKSAKPEKSKGACYSAVAGFIVEIILNILVIALGLF